MFLSYFTARAQYDNLRASCYNSDNAVGYSASLSVFQQDMLQRAPYTALVIHVTSFDSETTANSESDINRSTWHVALFPVRRFEHKNILSHQRKSRDSVWKDNRNDKSSTRH